VLHNGDLWITLLCVRTSPKTTSAAFGFEICGTDLAHVTGLDRDPQDWKVSYLSLVADGVHANPSASTVIEGDFLYIFTLDENGKRPEIFDQNSSRRTYRSAKNLQYLDRMNGGSRVWSLPRQRQCGTWRAEMTVRYHPELKNWIALLVDPNIFSAKILLRTSPSLTGPWTDGEVIYQSLNSRKTQRDTIPTHSAMPARNIPNSKGRMRSSLPMCATP